MHLCACTNTLQSTRTHHALKHAVIESHIPAVQ
jgi:hypothetical protein